MIKLHPKKISHLCRYYYFLTSTIVVASCSSTTYKSFEEIENSNKSSEKTPSSCSISHSLYNGSNLFNSNITTNLNVGEYSQKCDEEVNHGYITIHYCESGKSGQHISSYKANNSLSNILETNLTEDEHKQECGQTDNHREVTNNPLKSSSNNAIEQDTSSCEEHVEDNDTFNACKYIIFYYFEKHLSSLLQLSDYNSISDINSLVRKLRDNKYGLVDDELPCFKSICSKQKAQVYYRKMIEVIKKGNSVTESPLYKKLIGDAKLFCYARKVTSVLKKLNNYKDPYLDSKNKDIGVVDIQSSFFKRNLLFKKAENELTVLSDVTRNFDTLKYLCIRYNLFDTITTDSVLQTEFSFYGAPLSKKDIEEPLDDDIVESNMILPTSNDGVAIVNSLIKFFEQYTFEWNKYLVDTSLIHEIVGCEVQQKIIHQRENVLKAIELLYKLWHNAFKIQDIKGRTALEHLNYIISEYRKDYLNLDNTRLGTIDISQKKELMYKITILLERRALIKKLESGILKSPQISFVTRKSEFNQIENTIYQRLKIEQLKNSLADKFIINELRSAYKLFKTKSLLNDYNKVLSDLKSKGVDF